MTFSSPLWLLSLLLIPALIGLQALARARARRYAVRFPALTTLREAAGRGTPWRRWVPALLLLLSLAALALGLARPHVNTRVALRQASLVLVLDHSGSMAADDVQPSRLAAAERAANTFIDQLPSSVKVGVVAFSDAPDGVQGPTTNHVLARSVVDAQTASGATDTGDALALALQMLARGSSRPAGRSAIVLLSDGAANAGQSPVAVASQAARERVAIDTVALGTPDGVLQEPFGPPEPVPPDPQLMGQIAQASHGRTFDVQDANTLSSIYKSLGTALGSRTQQHEITFAFAAGGLLLLLAAAVASLRWAGRLP